MTGLEILEISTGATIQDLGRPGYRRFGVTRGGAMDRFALAEGQALMGNGAVSAALELFAVGGRFRSKGRVLIATSGAEMEISVNGHPRRWRSTVELEDGDLLRIGRAVEGVYGYLHLPGGIDDPVVLGSRSTHASSGLGRVPAPGQCLMALTGCPTSRRVELPRPEYFDSRTVRIADSPQSRLFPESDRQRLLTDEFRVSGKRNRMGIGLDHDGDPFDAVAGLTLTSDAVVPGDIQVAGNGTATALMADSQPVGGYPRIANVIAADQHVLAQLPSGTMFRMARTDFDKAVGALGTLAEQIRVLPNRVRTQVRDLSEIGNLLAYSMVSGVVRGDEDHED